MSERKNEFPEMLTAEDLQKPKCADFTFVRKIQKIQNQLVEQDLKKSDFDNFTDILKI